MPVREELEGKPLSAVVVAVLYAAAWVAGLVVTAADCVCAAYDSVAKDVTRSWGTPEKPMKEKADEG